MQYDIAHQGLCFQFLLCTLFWTQSPVCTCRLKKWIKCTSSISKDLCTYFCIWF